MFGFFKRLFGKKKKVEDDIVIEYDGDTAYAYVNGIEFGTYDIDELIIKAVKKDRAR